MRGWRSLVIGVDFTPCSASALRQAVRIAAWTNASLRAVHVIETLVVADLQDALGSVQTDLRAGLVEDARRVWKELGGDIPEASGLELDVEIDHPVAAILQRVRELSADLLVLGAHGASPPERGAGAVAMACVNKAPCSVLVVRNGQTGAFATVVACVDFSETSRRALGEAVQVAKRDGAVLHVLHVFEGPWHRLHYRAPTPQASPDYQKQYRDALRRRLETFCEPFLPALTGVELRIHVFDHVGYGLGIGEFVTQIGADLAVLGTHGRTHLSDFLLGSTAERVARDAACSILVVRPGSREAAAGSAR